MSDGAAFVFLGIALALGVLLALAIPAAIVINFDPSRSLWEGYRELGLFGRFLLKAIGPPCALFYAAWRVFPEAQGTMDSVGATVVVVLLILWASVRTRRATA